MYIFTWLITEVPKRFYKEILFTSQCCNNWIWTWKNSFDSSICLTQKINSIWIIYINIKAKAVKLIEWRGTECICDLGVGIEFLDRTQKWVKYTLNDKLNLMRSKNFHLSKCTNANKYASQRENVYYIYMYTHTQDLPRW